MVKPAAEEGRMGPLLPTLPRPSTSPIPTAARGPPPRRSLPKACGAEMATRTITSTRYCRPVIAVARVLEIVLARRSLPSPPPPSPHARRALEICHARPKSPLGKGSSQAQVARRSAARLPLAVAGDCSLALAVPDSAIAKSHHSRLPPRVASSPVGGDEASRASPSHFDPAPVSSASVMPLWMRREG